MKHWISLGFILLISNAFAQTEDLDATNKGFSNLTQAGKLFQVQMKPGENHLDLFVTGVNAGEIKVEDTKVEASIGVGEARQTVVATKTRDPKTGRFFYRMKRLKNRKIPLKLKIQSGDSLENFTFPPPN